MKLYEENLADIYSSANSVGDVCPNSDSISPDPASILSSATETIVIALNSLTSHHTQWEQLSQSSISILEHHSYPGTNDRKECRVGLRSREELLLRQRFILGEEAQQGAVAIA